MHSVLPERLHLQVFDVEGFKEVGDALCRPNEAIQLHEEQHDLSVVALHAPGVLQQHYGFPQHAPVFCGHVHVHVCGYVHVLMRDEKEERSKQGQTNNN